MDQTLDVDEEQAKTGMQFNISFTGKKLGVGVKKEMNGDICGTWGLKRK